MKLLLLDLDGTVRESASGATFINRPDDQKLISGVEDVIARYSDWTIIGITNQGGVATGHKSIEDATLEQKITLELCPQLKWIYFCPTYDGLECWRVDSDYCKLIKQHSIDEFGSFRKPGEGMIKLALQQFDKVGECLYAGDRPEDEQAAAAAGVPFVWADQWRSSAASFCKG